MGILGATVMPHNLYLHSSLVQSRQLDPSDEGKREACKMNLVDSAVALNAALFVNGAILVLAASAFHRYGFTNVGSLREAHQLLSPLLGNSMAPILFALALLCAGQASTITGTLAGQIVMVSPAAHPPMAATSSSAAALHHPPRPASIMGERGADMPLVPRRWR
jgi:manganese transport protein